MRRLDIDRERRSAEGAARNRQLPGRRNAVIDGFTQPPDKARTIVMRLNGGKGADYLLICNEMNEIKHYRADFPQGLAATLARDRPPQWLRQLPGKGPLRIYKVIAQPATKASATPFMQ